MFKPPSGLADPAMAAFFWWKNGFLEKFDERPEGFDKRAGVVVGRASGAGCSQRT
jgi:hypothetical protein